MLKKLIAPILMMLAVNAACAGDTVKIETPLYVSNIDTSTGQIVNVTLKKYSDDNTDGKQYEVISKDGLKLTGKYFTPSEDIPQTFTHYEKHLSGNKAYLVLANSPYYPTLKRKYVFDNDNYEITVTDTLVNNTAKSIDVAYHLSLSTPSEPKDAPLISSYKGFMYVDQYEKTHKHREPAVIKSPLFGIPNPQMVAYSDRFFSTAVGTTSKTKHLQSIERAERIELVIATDIQTIARSKSFSNTTTVYAGPITPRYINKVADIPHLDAVLDYGFLTTISNAFFNALSFINQYIPNYGFAIIAMTVLFRLVLYPLTLKVERSNRKLKELRPEIDQIKSEYNELQAPVLIKSLLQEHKVNPLVSLFIPMLQLPIFLSILWMLVSNSELRDSSWILWIKDLSSSDPYFVLPLVFGLLIFIQTRINAKMNAHKPTEDYIKFALNFMPIPMFLIFTMLPAGIVLYAITNTAITMGTRAVANQNL
ncbi:MAG: membrane protein insertase YidC [Methylophilus sp.]|uniref:membrane protein insertase YidC n=1 Tax=Methylophilus sp. TaxID=29541 RepID=UPI003FA1704D